jgi:hypothetical protein
MYCGLTVEVDVIVIEFDKIKVIQVRTNVMDEK